MQQLPKGISMKFFTLKSVTVLATLALSANAFAMDVKFSDAVWDGKKIPEGQQCLNYDGKSPATFKHSYRS